jgi:hypothetical protein
LIVIGPSSFPLTIERGDDGGIPKYLEREALNQFIPAYSLATHSLISLSLLCVLRSSTLTSHLGIISPASIRFEGKRRRFSLVFKVLQVSTHGTQYSLAFNGSSSSSSDKQRYEKLR